MLTVPAWLIPTALSLLFFGMMIRPYHASHDYDFGALFRLFWIVPILLTWLIYFGILVWLGK